MRAPALNTLRMFDAAARHGAFSRAADELNLTQGAVAQQVRKLEADLGQPLFTRLARGLKLTQAGALFHKDIRKALDMIDRATDNMRPDLRSVTLSVPPSLATKWLVPKLGDFTASHPTINLDLRASEMLTDFQKDRVDIAIRQGLPPVSEHVQAQLLSALDLQAVARPVDAKPARIFLNISDFADQKLIEDGHRHWAMLFQTNDLPPPQRSLAFNQTALAIDAALAGQGVALSPKLLVQTAVEAGQLEVLWSAPRSNQGYYVLHPDRPNPARDAVVAWLLHQATTT